MSKIKRYFNQTKGYKGQFQIRQPYSDYDAAGNKLMKRLTVFNLYYASDVPDNSYSAGTFQITYYCSMKVATPI